MQRDLEVKEIQKTNLTDTYEEFIFMSHGSDLFILKTNTSQQVKCVIEIFWKQTNTFAAAEVFEGEEVGIQIKSANNIENKLFYTGTGF